MIANRFWCQFPCGKLEHPGDRGCGGPREVKDAGPQGRTAFGLREVKFSAGRSFSGYGAVFGNVDAYGDVIAKSAFRESLREHAALGTMPSMLAQHGDWSGSGDGMMPIGVWSKIEEDDHGLRVEGRLSDTPRGQEAYTLLKDKALTGLSIGYRAREFTPGTKQGDPRRTLTNVELLEVSLVTFPANDLARIQSVKLAAGGNLTTRDCESALRDAGVPRELAKAIVAKGWRAATDQRDADGEADAVLVTAANTATETLTRLIERL